MITSNSLEINGVGSTEILCCTSLRFGSKFKNTELKNHCSDRQPTAYSNENADFNNPSAIAVAQKLHNFKNTSKNSERTSPG
jgi:hypothetical protein